MSNDNRNILHRYPLTTSQERLWVMWKLYPNTIANNAQCIFRFLGKLSIKKFQYAIDKLVSNNMLFQTRFLIEDDSVYQDFSSQYKATLEVVDFNTDTTLKINEEANYINQHINQIIDLLQFPLCKFSLYISKQQDQYYFSIVMPHILWDGLSCELFLKELSDYYNEDNEKASKDQTNILKPANTENVESALLVDKAYWRNKLKNSIPSVSFAFKRKNNNNLKTFRIHRYIKEKNTIKIKKISKALKTTPFLLMECMYAWILYYFTNQSDISTLYPVNIRTKNNPKAMGFYVNFIPTVFEFNQNKTFRSILTEITTQRKHDKLHQNFSFSYITHECLMNAPTTGFPFDAIFSQAGFFPSTFSLSGINIEFVPYNDSESFYPLSLIYDEHDHMVLLYFEYQTGAFDQCYIEEFANCYMELINCLEHVIDMPFHQIKFLSQKKQQGILKLLQNENYKNSNYSLITDWFNQTASLHDNKIAISDERRELSYQELLSESKKIAYLLSNKYKLKNQKRIAVLLDRNLDSVVIFLALLMLNVTYVPIDLSYPTSRIQYILTNSNCDFIISDSAFDSILSKLSTPPIIMSRIQQLIEGITPKSLDIKGSPTDIAYIIYTSGSTGKPKGTPISHHNMVALFSNTLGLFKFSSDDIWSVTHSFAFDFSIWEIFGALLTGAKLVVFSECVRKNPELLYDKIQQQKITVFNQTPSSFKRFMSIDKQKGLPLYLRYVIFGGEKLNFGDLQEWGLRHGIEQPYLINMYGLTEACIHVTYHYITLEDIEKKVSIIGRPLPSVQCLILSDANQLIPSGVIGELFIGGPTLTCGYLNDAKLNKEKFIPHPFNTTEKLYKTGDKAFYDNKGLLHYVDRTDDQVKLYGYRIELNEINTVIRHIDGIEDASTLLVSINKQPQLISFYVSKSHHADDRAIKNSLKQSLPFYMIPNNLVQVDEMPITTQGKIDKEKLRQFAESPKETLITVSSKHTLLRDSNTTLLAKVKMAWISTLGHKNFSLTDNFFDVGGNSILLIKLNTLLNDSLHMDLQLLDLFKYPSIELFISYLQSDNEGTGTKTGSFILDDGEKGTSNEEKIAVIGMACRFPKSKNIKEFWDNLLNGRECITFYTVDELRQSIDDSSCLIDKNYVKAKGEITDADLFDATFFDYNPTEASSLDPQQRLFLECAWQAMEDAGYVEERNALKMGVFASQSSLYPYHQWYISKNESFKKLLGDYKIFINNSVDFLTSRLSYKFNLTGPNMTIQTGCSSSLVSICHAAQALLDQQCDIAIAGGVALTMPLKSGYLYQPGMILSPDGHCRPFDKKASGTVPGNGAGVVILKRLSQAIKDRDHIEAIIQGVAYNNDGSKKIGFTAPSQTGQESVITLALHNANLSPDDVGYVEAHGTATIQGDPIEASAIDSVFQLRNRTEKLAIGSVKSNIGHLDTAAGIAGFIKTVLCLKHKTLVPSLHFNKLNPSIQWEKSHLTINATKKKWFTKGKKRYAGVSSFAIGGTNAHVILSEATKSIKTTSEKAPQLVLSSAKSEIALLQTKANLSEFLANNSHLNIQDVSYTLALGRKHFTYRDYLISESIPSIVNLIKNNQTTSSSVVPENKHNVVFLFSGQGTFRSKMGFYLMRNAPIFKDISNRCFKFLDDKFNLIVDFSYNYQMSDAEYDIKSPSLIFIFQYALAKQFMAWGVYPNNMIGHSLGEYVAATIANIWTIEDALAIVKIRSELMAKLPKGKMIGINASYKQISSLKPSSMAIAAINSPSQCVLSGNNQSMRQLETRLARMGIRYKYLKNKHAYHSEAIDSVIEDFRQALTNYAFHEPEITFISTLTSQPIQKQVIVTPEYWVKQMRHTVQFSSCVQSIHENNIFLEMGPTQTMSALTLQHNLADSKVINIFNAKLQPKTEYHACLNALGQLWQNGVTINWQNLYSTQECGRISLPPYPFERTKCWVPESQAHIKTKTLTYITDWKESNLINRKEAKKFFDDDKRLMIIFSDKKGIVEKLLVHWNIWNKKNVIKIYQGSSYTTKPNNTFTIHSTSKEHYEKISLALQQSKKQIGYILYCWTLDDIRIGKSWTFQHKHLSHIFSMSMISQHLLQLPHDQMLQLTVLNQCVFQIFNTDEISPTNALLLGSIMTLPHEYEKVSTNMIDISPNILKPTQIDERVVNLLTTEIGQSTTNHSHCVGYRRGNRYVTQYRPLEFIPDVKDNVLNKKQVYLISGGLGDMGLIFAKFFAQRSDTVIVLLHHSSFPKEEIWRQVQKNKKSLMDVKEKILILKELKKRSTIELIQTDISKYDEVSNAIRTVIKKYNYINGVVHAAGIADGKLIQEIDAEHIKKIISPKANGAWNLHSALINIPINFMVFCSALSSITGELGQMTYNSANAFLDYFAMWRSRYYGRTISINWDRVADVGMSKDQTIKHLLEKIGKKMPTEISKKNLVEIFADVISSTQSHIIVSKDFLPKKIGHTLTLKEIIQAKSLETNLDKTTPEIDISLNEKTIITGLKSIFSNYLGKSDISEKTDIFTIGIDSLAAIQIAKALTEKYELEPQPHILLTYPTLEKLSHYILTKKSSFNTNQKNIAIQSIVKIREGKGKQNLFIMHPVGGTVYLYRDLANEINPNFTVYGVQSYQLDKDNPYYNKYMSVEEMATHYIRDIQKIQKQGPYLLAGASFGGTLAYEMSYQLQKHHHQAVDFLAMMDTPHPFNMPKKLLDDNEIIKYMLMVGANHQTSKTFDNLSHQDQLKYFAKYSNNLSKIMPDLDIKDIEQFLSVYKLNIRAMFNYKLHKSYHADNEILFFRAKGRDAINPATPEKAWEKSLGKNIKVFIVPGGHVNMLFLPQNEQMLVIINRFLKKININI